MPELPDIEAYRVALSRTVVGQKLLGIEINHPFLLRSVAVDPQQAGGTVLDEVRRLGKRLVLPFRAGPVLVIHLMIAGRLKWKRESLTEPPPRKRGGKGQPLARLFFPSGILSLTEAGTRRRASLHVLASMDEVGSLDPGGAELLEPGMSAARFAAILRQENHTVKRSLTDPRLFAGIGNAYSDEILFHAKLSPFLQTRSISDEEMGRLFTAVQETLTSWTDRLVAEAEHRFPAKVTAFRPEMHVHGKYGEPCSVCGTPVQRIRYAENECNYCPGCQTGGRVYADRALSRLLKDDWPRTVEELESLTRPPEKGA